MLVDFLDALGIEHKEGVVEDLPPTMDDAKLRAAVDALLAKYPPEAVAVYLHAFNDMNEVDWPNLKTMLESDPRLQLGGAHSLNPRASCRRESSGAIPGAFCIVTAVDGNCR